MRDRSHAPVWLYVAAFLVLVGLLLDATADAARASTRTTATWYGPGFYGNAFACSHLPSVPNRYSRNVRGAAHMSLPCGAKVTICRHRRCVRVRVIDRGAFDPRNLDLTARTAMDLCGCSRPYTQRVVWRRGWS